MLAIDLSSRDVLEVLEASISSQAERDEFDLCSATDAGGGCGGLLTVVCLTSKDSPECLGSLVLALCDVDVDDDSDDNAEREEEEWALTLSGGAMNDDDFCCLDFFESNDGNLIL